MKRSPEVEEGEEKGRKPVAVSIKENRELEQESMFQSLMVPEGIKRACADACHPKCAPRTYNRGIPWHL